jgi:hypothetical protein
MPPLICPTCGSQTPRLAVAPGTPLTCLKCHAAIPDELLSPQPEQAEGETSAPAAYRVERFHATRGGSPAGAFVALGVGLLGAVVLGALSAVIRGFFWAVLIFPILLGFGVGVVAGGGAWMAKLRRPEFAAGAGAVAGLAAAFVLHYVRYLILTADFPAGQQVTFPQFLDLLCQAGVMGFGYTGSMIYYSVEVIVIVIAAGAGALVFLNRPFCEECNAWKQKEQLGPYKINATVAVNAVASGYPAAMVAPAEGDETVTLEIFRCPHCRDSGPIDVRANGTISDGKNTATATVFVTYPGEAATDFEEVRRQCSG